VLSGDDRDLGAGLGERREDGLRAQEFGIVHHHLLPALAVIEIVAADAVHGRRRAGDDGEIVWIGEARHHAIADGVGAVGQHPTAPGHTPAAHRLREIGGLAAVNADDDDGLARPGVGLAVDCNVLAHVSYSALAACLSGLPLVTPSSAITARIAESAPFM